MKTIIIKDVFGKMVGQGNIKWKKVLPAAGFVFAMYLLGRAAGESMADSDSIAVNTMGDIQIRGEHLAQYTNADVLSQVEEKTENWGLGFGKKGEKPTGTASVAEMKKYNAYYMKEGEEKVLYLTFDCGYENGNTEAILDALKKHNISATFFVVGHFLESAPDLAKRMVEEGHTLGNHTYHHPDMSKISDCTAFQKEVDAVREKYQEVIGGEMPMYYRPPQGKYSTLNLQMAKELGYSTFFWSLAYVDWNVDQQPSREEALEKLTNRAHPGAIVLLHNTSKTNGEILDEILTKWEEMGYSFGKLEEFIE